MHTRNNFTITLVPEELGLRKFFRIESPVAAQRKRIFIRLLSLNLGNPSVNCYL